MHATLFVQVYANPFIGKRIMNIKKWGVRRNVLPEGEGVRGGGSKI